MAIHRQIISLIDFGQRPLVAIGYHQGQTRIKSGGHLRIFVQKADWLVSYSILKQRYVNNQLVICKSVDEKQIRIKISYFVLEFKITILVGVNVHK